MTSHDVKLFAESIRILGIFFGMHAENQQRAACGHSMAYTERDFSESASTLNYHINETMAKNVGLNLTDNCPGCVRAASRCAICEAVIRDEAASFSLGPKLNYLCDDCAKARGLCAEVPK